MPEICLSCFGKGRVTCIGKVGVPGCNGLGFVGKDLSSPCEICNKDRKGKTPGMVKCPKNCAASQP